MYVRSLEEFDLGAITFRLGVGIVAVDEQGDPAHHWRVLAEHLAVVLDDVALLGNPLVEPALPAADHDVMDRGVFLVSKDGADRGAGFPYISQKLCVDHLWKAGKYDVNAGGLIVAVVDPRISIFGDLGDFPAPFKMRIIIEIDI